MQRMLTHPPSLSLSMKIKLKLSVRISTSGGTSGGRLSSTSSTPAPPLYKSDGAPVNTGGDPSTLSDPNGGAAQPNAGANTTAAPSTAVSDLNGGGALKNGAAAPPNAVAAPANTTAAPSTAVSDPNGGGALKNGAAAPPNAAAALANTTAAPSTAVRVDSKKTDSAGFIKGFSEELGKLVAKDGWEEVVKELKKKNLEEWIKTLMALGMIIKHMISGKLPPSLPPP